MSLTKICCRFGSVTRKHVLLILSLVVFCGQYGASSAFAASAQVVPIKWSAFKAEQPIDQLGATYQSILLNTSKYAMTTWWQVRGYAAQKGQYLDFFGTDENNLRPAADEAFALAVSIKTGVYDSKKIGVTTVVSKQRLNKLISSLAFRHRAVSKNGWGNSWQSALWASKAGWAAWLTWDSLSLQDKKNVQAMVEYEANRFNTYPPPYYRDPNGKINYPGDTKAEENAWNAGVLQLATAMMPNHPNFNIWHGKMLQLMISSFARPLDLKSREIVDGKMLSSWLRGSNIDNDGTLTNRGRMHPDYMTTITLNIQAALMYSLAQLPVPRATFYNADIIYKALSDGKFYGSHIYNNGSGSISYPRGTALGLKRRMNFALLDIEAKIFGFDNLATKKGDYWASLHAFLVNTMQLRSGDGRTYLTAREDKYPGREEWVAEAAAQAYLAKWLQAWGGLKTYNQK